jgi:hypothetical protein
LITSKEEYITTIMKLVCKRCSRKQRIQDRLEDELTDSEYDYEKDVKVSKIIEEEA